MTPLLWSLANRLAKCALLLYLKPPPNWPYRIDLYPINHVPLRVEETISLYKKRINNFRGQDKMSLNENFSYINVGEI